LRAPEGAPSARPAARAAISVLIVAVLTVVLLGSFRRDLIADRLWRIGFQQSWDVYAPQPIRRIQTFEAVITYTDGTASTWRIPRASAVFPYPMHRWERWADSITGNKSLRWWRPTAQWIASAHAAPGRVPAKVTLRRRWMEVPPPGARHARQTWSQADLATVLLR
jgi:hypothetical protein